LSQLLWSSSESAFAFLNASANFSCYVCQSQNKSVMLHVKGSVTCRSCFHFRMTLALIHCFQRTRPAETMANVWLYSILCSHFTSPCFPLSEFQSMLQGLPILSHSPGALDFLGSTLNAMNASKALTWFMYQSRHLSRHVVWV
jgi:hypothetical protein